MKNLLIIIVLFICFSTSLLAQQNRQKKTLPFSVYTTKTISLYRYNESKGQMVYLTEAEIRKEKQYVDGKTLFADGSENGYNYFISYALLSYKNNKVWVNVYTSRSASTSNINGYSHSIYINDKIGTAYFNKF